MTLNYDKLSSGAHAFIDICAEMSSAISDGVYSDQTFAHRVNKSRSFCDELKQDDDTRIRLLGVKMREIVAEMRKLSGCNGSHARKWERVRQSVTAKAEIFEKIMRELTEEYEHGFTCKV